jgi:hypothetical protein
MKKNAYEEIFAPDDGLLLDIKVFDAGPRDWEKLLLYLTTQYLVVYSENRVVTPQPDFATIWHRTKEKAVQLEIMLPGFTVRAHIFQTEEIEMDLRPEEVDSNEKACAVFELMSGTASELGKEVFLIPEYASATQQQLREMAICSADPRTGKIKYYKAPGTDQVF